MLYRKIEKTGDSLSILGYGCMRFPTQNGGIDYKKADEQIRYAISQGVNYFDTAFPYHAGASETVLGKVLSNGLRDQVKIATKLPIYIVNTRKDMDEFLNTQLIRLQTDRIDYYLLHNINNKASWDKMVSLGVLEFLTTAKKDGRILHTGFSFHGSKTLFKEVVDAYSWDVCQIQYNFLDTENQAGTEGLKYAAEKGLGIIIMEPLRGGKLAGKVPSEVEKLWGQSRVKRTAAEWSFRWIWNHPEVHVVLSGMNEDEHIRENLRIASDAAPNALTLDELELVAKVRETYRRLMKVGCTGCNYCMPCPFGVNIPQCFERYNNKSLFREKGRFAYYEWLGGIISPPGYASLCKQCGKCEKLCPQQIPIRQELKNVAEVMEGPLMKPILLMAKPGFALMSKLQRKKKP
ncbi:MAG: aldo/keto reductase [Thermoclostridium sp.]|nr:aldo/keto reductase [Thermoclostridium sp.]